MYVESFHRVLKVVYLEKKQNCRVDCLLSILLQMFDKIGINRILLIDGRNHVVDMKQNQCL